MRAPCKIEGCERESRGRGWCGTHWLRWKKHGDPLKVLTAGVDYQQKTVCSVEDCDRLAHAHGLCGKHVTRWRKHGDPLHETVITGRPWKGVQPTWGAVHRRLSRKRGRAADKTCVDCARPAAEWSYDGQDPAELHEVQTPGGKPIAYSLDLERYVPRCVPCHRVHDIAARRAEEVPA